jgi:hypothetical protein
MNLGRQSNLAAGRSNCSLLPAMQAPCWGTRTIATTLILLPLSGVQPTWRNMLLAASRSKLTHCRSPADGRMHAIAANFARTIACWGEKLRLFPFRLPRSLLVQRLGGRSSPPACAGYVRKQRFAVRWNIVAAPGNMLIGTD